MIYEYIINVEMKILSARYFLNFELKVQNENDRKKLLHLLDVGDPPTANQNAATA